MSVSANTVTATGIRSGWNLKLIVLRSTESTVPAISLISPSGWLAVSGNGVSTTAPRLSGSAKITPFVMTMLPEASSGSSLRKDTSTNRPTGAPLATTTLIGRSTVVRPEAIWTASE